MDKKVLPCFDPRMRGKDRLLSSETWKRRAGKRPTTGISSRSTLERYSSDNVAASLPFSDHHDPNELPRLPSPNHGDVACLDATFSFLENIVGARLIRKWEAKKIISEWTPYRYGESFSEKKQQQVL